MSFRIDAAEWSEQQFADCQLGDRRRTRRLMKVAEQVANDPSASFPDQMKTWGDLKAAYRLFDCEDVTFEAIAAPHWQQTRAVEPGRYLVLADTTEIDFGYKRDIKGLSKIGNGSGRGFLLHNGLLVDAENQSVIGVAGQTIHYRKPRPKKENAAQRFKRERESRVWGDLIDQIGRPDEGVQLVHVCDRGADDFEVFCHLLQNDCDWVVRASSLHRHVITLGGEKMPLQEYLRGLSVAGMYELQLRARPRQSARTATLEVRFGRLAMPIPKHKSPYVKSLDPQPIEMWVVWVREIDAPADVSPIEWVLYTSLPVTTFDEAWEVVGDYECRWLVEEYHKALKTGCSVQRRLLRETDRLEAMVGLMSVVSVRLLQLKSVARSDPDRPARAVVPLLWLQMLKAVRKKLRRVHDLTIYEFYREVAKLGGFLGRRSDGEPGWITIWRGWEKLNTLVQGAQLAIELKKCG
ncbi:MAG: IS4 family transposase [Planctomycetota bacterium]|nr:IS4 family transposase [Planctomycetota bacterium]